MSNDIERRAIDQSIQRLTDMLADAGLEIKEVERQIGREEENLNYLRTSLQVKKKAYDILKNTLKEMAACEKEMNEERKNESES